HYVALRQAVAPEGLPEPAAQTAPTRGRSPALPGPEPHGQPERRARRWARYEEVVRLRAQGASGPTIAARVGGSLRTVHSWLQAGPFPERKRRSERPSPLAPFAADLRARWAQGCHNARQLWRELREQGFAGGYRSVAYYVSAWRRGRSRSIGQEWTRP